MIEVKDNPAELAKKLQDPDVKFNLFKMLGYEPTHPEVIRMHRSTAQCKVNRAPRRASKSWSGAFELMPTCLTPDTRTWIVGDSYNLAEKEFRVVHDHLVLKCDKIGIPKPRVCQTNAKNGQLYIKWPWGAVLEGKTADRPEGLLGDALHHVLYSEAAQMPRQIRERYIMQTLITTQGKEIIPTTPGQAAEWVKELDDLGASGKYDWIESFHWDVTANPLYDINEMQKAIDVYGIDHPMVREQYFGEWTFYGGRVYPMFRPETHVIDPFEIPSNWRRFRGIDFGHRDPFVCLFMAIGPNDELYLYKEYYCRDGLSTREHAQKIKEMSQGEFFYRTIGDPTSKQLIEDMNYEGIPVDAGNNDRAAGRARVSEYMAMTEDGVPPFKNNVLEGPRFPRLYVFNNCVETIRECLYYHWQEGKNIEGSREKTEGEDHAMDTLRYMIMERPSPARFSKKVKPGTFDWHFKKAKDKPPMNRLAV